MNVLITQSRGRGHTAKQPSKKRIRFTILFRLRDATLCRTEHRCLPQGAIYRRVSPDEASMCFKCVLEYVSNITPSQYAGSSEKEMPAILWGLQWKDFLAGFSYEFLQHAMCTPAQNDLEHVLTTTIAVYLG